MAGFNLRNFLTRVSQTPGAVNRNTNQFSNILQTSYNGPYPIIPGNPVGSRGVTTLPKTVTNFGSLVRQLTNGYRGIR